MSTYFPGNFGYDCLCYFTDFLYNSLPYNLLYATKKNDHQKADAYTGASAFCLKYSFSSIRPSFTPPETASVIDTLYLIVKKTELISKYAARKMSNDML